MDDSCNDDSSYLFGHHICSGSSSLLYVILLLLTWIIRSKFGFERALQCKRVSFFVTNYTEMFPTEILSAAVWASKAIKMQQTLLTTLQMSTFRDLRFDLVADVVEVLDKVCGIVSLALPATWGLVRLRAAGRGLQRTVLWCYS